MLVSHSLEQVRQGCSRALWLDHGSIVADGPAGPVADAYHEWSQAGPDVVDARQFAESRGIARDAPAAVPG